LSDFSRHPANVGWRLALADQELDVAVGDGHAPVERSADGRHGPIPQMMTVPL
jgi:hypothetical protein